MISGFRKFVRDLQALDDVLAKAKQISCPHCHRAGTVVGHGLLLGYAEYGSDREIRGRRLLCSGRWRRPGCGRTFAVLLATVLAGFSVRTHTLSRLLRAVLSGLSRKAAWDRQPTPAGLSLRSGYRLWARLVRVQSQIRSVLCALTPPTPCDDARPIAQMFEHLRQALREPACVFADFQFTFQRDLFG